MVDTRLQLVLLLMARNPMVPFLLQLVLLLMARNPWRTLWCSRCCY